MSGNSPDTEQRMRELVAAAKELTDLPVADQYQRLTVENGLRLSDTGWGKVYDPGREGLQKHVTVIPVVRPQGDRS